MQGGNGGSVKTREERSAGGVIYRAEGGGADVCLIATHDGNVWQLPKGLIEPGEKPEATARREVAEETGLNGELLQPLDETEYWYVWDYGDGPERVHKLVKFYLLRYVDGSTDDHDHEADEARWFPIGQARGRLAHDNERRIMALAEQALAGMNRGQ